MNIERRDYSLEELEVRETSEGRTIRGMAVPFNRNSQDLGGFIERVDSKAIALDGSDVVMLWQHDAAQPITRESTGLKLELRSSGLWFEAAASDFTDRQLDLLSRGVVGSMSFGFHTVSDSWETERKPVPRRTLTSINLREISPVTWPAYNATKVAVRSAQSAGIALAQRVVPDNISTEVDEDRRAEWAKPTLEEFTSSEWSELSDTERDAIAGHYTWSPEMPPSTFTSLSLPHHRASDGRVVWRGLVAAAARLDQTDLPDSAMGAVRAHLAAHYRAFGEEAPWDRSSPDVSTQRDRLRLVTLDLG